MSVPIESLFEHCRQELVGFLVRIVHHREIARDMAQQSFLILLRESRQQVIEHPRGFLFRTARNLALDHLKHERIVDRYRSTEAPGLETHRQRSAEDLAGIEEYGDRLQAALSLLPPLTRQCMVLHRVYGYTYGEIAHQLGLTERTVENHLKRALLHCRAQLRFECRQGTPALRSSTRR